MNYTHKILNIGCGYPSVGETILDDSEKQLRSINYLRCINISAIHTEVASCNWVYAICEKAMLGDGQAFNGITNRYSVKKIRDKNLGEQS
jgi:hypothetical protein